MEEKFVSTLPPLISDTLVTGMPAPAPASAGAAGGASSAGGGAGGAVSSVAIIPSSLLKSTSLNAGFSLLIHNDTQCVVQFRIFIFF